MTQPKVKKLTKLEALTISVAQDYAHQHTATIQSKRRMLQCEAQEIDASIVALQATLMRQRERRAKVAATIDGLTSVIGKR